MDYPNRKIFKTPNLATLHLLDGSVVTLTHLTYRNRQRLRGRIPMMRHKKEDFCETYFFLNTT